MTSNGDAPLPVEHTVNETPCEPARPRPLPGLYLAIGLFVAAYWMVVGVALQTVDLSQPPAWWEEQLAALPLLGLIPTWLVSYLTTLASWTAARHILIPFLAGWLLANAVGTGFVQRFYNFPSRAAAAQFLHRLQQKRSDGLLPRASRRLHPALILTIITTPFAAFFLILSLIGPPSLRGSALYNALLVILGGVWFILCVAYLLSYFMSDTPASGLRLQRDTLDEMRKTQALLRVGGPGRVIVANSDAAVTEYNGRFCRVLGPGAHRLRPFEYVSAIVDLRPQERHGEVHGMTQDGIGVAVDASVTFRIARDDRHIGGSASDAPRPTKQQLYLFGHRAVAQAAYAETLVRGDEDTLQALLWSSRPLEVVGHQFRRALSERPLVELFDPESGKKALHANLVDTIRQESRSRLFNDGIELTSLHLGPLRAREEVLAQNLNGWRTFWQEQRIREQESEVQTVALAERARREAEVMMLHAVLDSVQEAQYEDDTRLSRAAMAVRLLQALHEATCDLYDQELIEGQEGEGAVERLRALQARLSGNDTLC